MWELRFEITREKWEILELVLSSFEPTAITTSCGDVDLFDLQHSTVESLVWEQFQVSILFEDKEKVDSAYSILLKVEGLSRSLKKNEIREDVDWNSEWKKSWDSMTLSSGLHISPSWLSIPAHVTNTIRIDPSRAFGTGTHETTKMCLDYLDSFSHLKSLKIIDYGCGSGILSLAAAALGCSQIMATDNDRLALEITRENATLNSFQKVITVLSPEQIKQEKCDLLVANILLDALLNLKTIFSALVRKKGFLILSGVMVSQVDILVSSYESEFIKQEIKILNNWCMLVFSKR